MKIGQWRQRIVIQQNRMTMDQDGNQRNEWADYFTCWAYANNLSGKEYWEAAQVNQQESLFFLVRYCTELKELDSIGMINDMYAESRNDECKYAQLATQKDFDEF